jgi:hypothetical protein
MNHRMRDRLAVLQSRAIFSVVFFRFYTNYFS